MSTSLTVLPNDGPVMRWAIKHSKRYLVEKFDREMIGDDISNYRHHRDCNAPYSTIRRPINIAGLAGTIEMIGGTYYYYFKLSFEDIWISETLTHISSDRKLNPQKHLPNLDPTKSLSMGIKLDLPFSMVESLIGEKADRSIDLPKPLKNIIAGRTIISAKHVGPTILADLSGDA